MEIGEVELGQWVLVRGQVTNVYAASGLVLVRVAASTSATVSAGALRPDTFPPPEPEDGVWMVGTASGTVSGDDDVPNVFVRRDQPFSADPEKRWFDYGEGQWVTWRTAVSRGAAKPMRATS